MTHKAYRVINRSEAERDIDEAAVRYHQRQPGLGEESLEAIRLAIANAAKNPFVYRCLRRKPEVRKVMTKRFPYRVFFVRRDDAIVIFRVLHNVRDDREWQSNLPS